MSAGCAGALPITLNSPAAGATLNEPYPPVATSISFSTTDAYTFETFQVASDEKFVNILQTYGSNTHTANIPLVAGTYYWRVVASDGTTSANNTFTVAYLPKSFPAGATGAYGCVYDSSTLSGISGATVTVTNGSAGGTAIKTTSINGYWQVDGLTGGTYNIQISYTGYNAGSGIVNVVNSSYAMANNPITSSASNYYPHYVAFNLQDWNWKDIFHFMQGVPFVPVYVFKGQTTSGQTIAVGQTDNMGVFGAQLTEDQYYTLHFYDPTQSVDETVFYYGAQPEQVVRSYSAVIGTNNLTANNSKNTIPLTQDQVLNFSGVTTAQYNLTAYYINLSLDINKNYVSAPISTYSINVYSVSNVNGSQDGVTAVSQSGTGSVNFSCIVPYNASYQIATTATQPNLTTAFVDSEFTTLPGSGIDPYFNFGWNDQWNYWLVGIVLLLGVGGLCGATMAGFGSLILIIMSWFFSMIGWFKYDTTEYGMTVVAFLIVLIYIMNNRRSTA